MKVLDAFLVITLSILCGAQKIEVHNGVSVLTQENFKDFISSRDYVLVDFYAPWCGQCQDLEPEYAMVAQTLALSESPVELGKVDVTEEESLADDHNIKVIPTLVLFKKGKTRAEYTGELVAEKIVEWLTRRCGPPAQDLQGVENVQALIEEFDVVVIGFFKDQSSKNAEVFLEFADSTFSVPFGITSDEDSFAEYSVKNGDIVLFKKFDDRKVKFGGELNVKGLQTFLREESRPLISEFEPDLLETDGVRGFVLLFLDKLSEESSRIEDEARSVAKLFKQDIMFVSVDTEIGANQAALDMLNVKDEDVPTMRIAKPARNIKRFVPESNDLTAESIQKFVEDYLSGKIKPQFLGADLPEDWKKGFVYTLVSSNFESVVFDTEKDVLVEFHKTSCGYCKLLHPILEQVGEYFKRDTHVIVAKIDISVNEIDDDNFQSLPALKLYLRGDKKVITYKGAITVEAIANFIKNPNAGDIGNEDKSQEEEAEEDEDYVDGMKDEL
ncbi:hypothetical protein PPYR_10322 [Photinus pyralis]|uniref:protein disulfide-isomerase n=1 Tax=Photinus pyralis TaxID=7054 RepID=A0A5N4AG13_PHOPY|nr:protein disulfide-isomerase-like [Photinus pyralis]KAB0796261.1 hypothetical protein PPYR_10322 [Photinus pyralis]